MVWIVQIRGAGDFMQQERRRNVQARICYGYAKGNRRSEAFKQRVDLNDVSALGEIWPLGVQYDARIGASQCLLRACTTNEIRRVDQDAHA